MIGYDFLYIFYFFHLINLKSCSALWLSGQHYCLSDFPSRCPPGPCLGAPIPPQPSLGGTGHEQGVLANAPPCVCVLRQNPRQNGLKDLRSLQDCVEFINDWKAQVDHVCQVGTPRPRNRYQPDQEIQDSTTLFVITKHTYTDTPRTARWSSTVDNSHRWRFTNRNVETNRTVWCNCINKVESFWQALNLNRPLITPVNKTPLFTL